MCLSESVKCQRVYVTVCRLDHFDVGTYQPLKNETLISEHSNMYFLSLSPSLSRSLTFTLSESFWFIHSTHKFFSASFIVVGCYIFFFEFLNPKFCSLSSFKVPKGGGEREEGAGG